MTQRELHTEIPFIRKRKRHSMDTPLEQKKKIKTKSEHTKSLKLQNKHNRVDRNDFQTLMMDSNLACPS